MKLVLSSFLLLLVAASGSSAQNWKVCWSPDKTFFVELPVVECPVATFEGSDGPATVPGPNTDKGVSIYRAFQQKPEERYFEIIVVDVKNSGATSAEIKKGLSNIEGIIGGDEGKVTSKTSFTSNGLKGIEYVFSKKTSGEFACGRGIDAGDFVFIVIFRTESAADLHSKDAERFFKSFRYYPQKSVKPVKSRSFAAVPSNWLDLISKRAYIARKSCDLAPESV